MSDIRVGSDLPPASVDIELSIQESPRRETLLESMVYDFNCVGTKSPPPNPGLTHPWWVEVQLVVFSLFGV